MIRAYFLLASVDCSIDLAPVTTILPLPNTKAVVLGSISLIITAANLFGMYSVLRPFHAIYCKFNLQLRLTVDTIFCICGSLFLGIYGISDWTSC